jgi:hypothetical protein
MSFVRAEHFGTPFTVTSDKVPDFTLRHAEYLTLDVEDVAALAATTPAPTSVILHADSRIDFK